MNWEAIWDIVWQALNSAPGVMLMGGLLGWLFVRLYSAKPSWEAYEGTIISAIRHAEKAIPDDAQNKGVARLDEALRYVLRVYAETHRGQEPSDSLALSLREGVQIMHDRLEARGVV